MNEIRDLFNLEVTYLDEPKLNHNGKLYFYATGLKFIPFDQNTSPSVISKDDIESI